MPLGGAAMSSVFIYISSLIYAYKEEPAAPNSSLRKATYDF